MLTIKNANKYNLKFFKLYISPKNTTKIFDYLKLKRTDYLSHHYLAFCANS